MATYQILYWQDLPSQVKAWDDFDEVKAELSARFATRIDQAAQAQGLTAMDDYLAQKRRFASSTITRYAATIAARMK